MAVCWVAGKRGFSDRPAGRFPVWVVWPYPKHTVHRWTWRAPFGYVCVTRMAPPTHAEQRPPATPTPHPSAAPATSEHTPPESTPEPNTDRDPHASPSPATAGYTSTGRNSRSPPAEPRTAHTSNNDRRTPHHGPHPGPWSTPEHGPLSRRPHGPLSPSHLNVVWPSPGW